MFVTWRRPPDRSSRGVLVRAVTAAAVLSGWGSTPPVLHADEAQAEQGRVVYERQCVSCHGPQGKGDGPAAPFLSPRPGNLISAATSVKSDAELLAVISNGKPRTSMPAWRETLTEEQRHDVLAYIRSLVRFQKADTPPPPRKN